MSKYYFTLFIVLGSITAYAQGEATFKEFYKSYTTYPFSDPDPVPSAKKIYPYYRFDGFTTEAVEKEWKVVLLENDYISVQIMPEIGGKVWTAMDKTSGKDFFYNNEVVKFRDIAMRGPWVSGGIEANYGIIGHTPNSATPVDYLVRQNEDGSVSCFTSTLDLLTRTRWTMEINLEKDKAYFTTRSFWFNSTGMEQPYYSWMNAGIPVGKSLKFLYPGTHSIGHGGEASEWSVDELGRDLSYYEQNAFGGSKSYHVLGEHSKYFGALWEDDDFGMIHYSKREDKLGKKIFLWAQSEEGQIWEDLLTDESGQYVEIQSGRLFNQNDFQSSLTPFKQIGFTPYSSENWTEYWFPFKGLNGFTNANLLGAYNVKNDGNALTIRMNPVQVIQDSLKVFNREGLELKAVYLEAKPMQLVEMTLDLPSGEKAFKIELGRHSLTFEENDDHQLSRPVEIAEGFQENEAYGLYLQGRDLARFRNYEEAEKKINESLEIDPFLLPSLVEMAKLKIFRMEYDSAFYYSKKALSIDTYDGAANYYYGQAADRLGLTFDALDGFEVASLTSELRNASYTALSQKYMKQREFGLAGEYAFLALKNNIENIDALSILLVLSRIDGDDVQMRELKGRIQEINPLNHLVRFEDYYLNPSDENRQLFTQLIQNEMPLETFLELGIWYANLGLLKEAIAVIELSPENSETLYWLAWLNKDQNPEQSKTYLSQAGQTNPDFVFPFREESAIALAWAAEEDDAWQASYLLALIHDYRGNGDKAMETISQFGEDIAFAPFYVFRSRLLDNQDLKSKLHNVALAARLNPDSWRYGVLKSRLMYQMGNQSEAVNELHRYFQKNRKNYIVGLELVRMLVGTEQYKTAEKILANIHVLPFEGATGARRYYRETKLMLAHSAMEKRNFKEALKKIDEAEIWPKQLGVGKPFPGSIDANLENWMRSRIYSETGKVQQSRDMLEKVTNKEISDSTYVGLIKAITSKTDRRLF
ncbi:DUF5107 domain-containing protein [Lunatibacter salilacus]|uniref:DUF5107 domain-containing protein n=1 Tax=Lunatibacter salilacus TaxID=2483804 RepID=UPI00131DB978|nr:DUF5107 domain-containing protein [Lunatibacter salilacus]